MIRPAVLLLHAFWVPLAPPPIPAEHACTCVEAKLNGGWCARCKVGYLANVKIECESLFELLDAHGHRVDPAKIQCESCQAAMKTGGFCERCGMGYVDKLAFLSMLTYQIAKGEPVDRSTLTCPTCSAASARYGWCDACNVGMIGNVRIKSKGDFARASKAFQIFLAANEASRTCETCALAIVTDSACRKCGIHYKDGQPVKPQSNRGPG